MWHHLNRCLPWEKGHADSRNAGPSPPSKTQNRDTFELMLYFFQMCILIRIWNFKQNTEPHDNPFRNQWKSKPHKGGRTKTFRIAIMILTNVCRSCSWKCRQVDSCINQENMPNITWHKMKRKKWIFKSKVHNLSHMKSVPHARKEAFVAWLQELTRINRPAFNQKGCLSRITHKLQLPCRGMVLPSLIDTKPMWNP